jgi:hypothetical protein
VRALHNSFEQRLPGVSEDTFGRANEVRTPSLLSSQADNDSGSVGEGNARGNGRPPGQWRALQPESAEQSEDTTEEALNGGAFAQIVGRPSRRQAGPILLSLGIPGDHGYRAQRGVDPRDQAQSPIPSIQSDDTRTQPVERHPQRQQRPGEESIMPVGRSQQEEHRQARAAAQQRVDAVTQQQRAGIVVRGVAVP